ncbi:MAG: aldehyde dehydrogenase (NADP(+)) [Alteraurantiacibacter sp.]
MAVDGSNLIGSRAEAGRGEVFGGYDPARRAVTGPSYAAADRDQLDAACALADLAAKTFGETSREDRAGFLDMIAAKLEASRAEIVAAATSETGLPEARIRGELGRTTGQLRMFGRVLRDGGYLDIRVDRALPDRAPPRPDLRLMNRPLGPVAVFGASNFPLAFSVAGGDTASALAAGCPVIAKAHPAHPATSELAGRAIQQAVADTRMPEGTFSLLFESGIAIGQALVADPRIAAVGFTGSRKGGLALVEIAQKRAVPIPVYAEMSAINPVVLMPEALTTHGRDIGAAFGMAQTMGAGQFCTNPGLLLALESSDLDSFVEGVSSFYDEHQPATMLTPKIHAAYCEGVDRLAGREGVTCLARGQEADGHVSRPGLYRTDAETFLADRALSDEVFGATSLVITCRNMAQMVEVLGQLEGQLTGAIHATDGEADNARPVLEMLEARCGRVLFNGFGTGVEVCDAMVHGGPYPSTSDVRSTSVGTLAIARFLRPVCYQDVPDALLPGDLRDANLQRLPHLEYGERRLP